MRPTTKCTVNTAFRADIQALRAIAVLLVLGFHVWPTLIKGGYVGVDVFFVISGYLITSHLVREVTATGCVDLPGFYARRARRLLPAASLTLVAVGFASYALMPPSTWPTTAKDMAVSALYAQNWALVSRSVDYLAQDQAPSPLQHFWSLAVEEQFYGVWPLIVAGVASVWRRQSPATGAVSNVGGYGKLDAPPVSSHGVSTPASPPPGRRAYVLPMGAMVCASFVAAVYYALFNPAPGYFMTHVRLHELGLGGLLAVWTCGDGAKVSGDGFVLPQAAREGQHSSWSRHVRCAVAATGLTVIACTGLLYTPRLPFPGFAALLPVAGAACVIAAGEGGEASHALIHWLSHPWLQYLGDASYSLYLAHWPVVAMYPVVTGKQTDSSLADSALVLVLSWAMAHACKTGWEDRFRGIGTASTGSGHASTNSSQQAQSPAPPRSQPRPWSAFRLAAALTGAVLFASGSLAGVARTRMGGWSADDTTHTSHALSNATHPGAEAWVNDASWRKHAKASDAVKLLPLSQIVPSLNRAEKDRGQAYMALGNGKPCVADTLDKEVKQCTPGPGPEIDNGTVDVLPEAQDATAGPRANKSAPLPSPQRKHIVLVGDSHAVHWLPALYEVGETHGWNVTGLTKTSCLPANITVEVRSRGSAGRLYTECRAWTDNVVDWVTRTRPDAVILSASPMYNLPNLDWKSSRHDLAAGVVQVVRAMVDAGVPVLAIKHTPFRREAVPTCLARARARGLETQGAIDACTAKAELPGGALNEAAAQFSGMRLLNFDDAFVDAAGRCPPIIGNVIVYRDGHHLTASYARTLAPALARRLVSALAGVL